MEEFDPTLVEKVHKGLMAAMSKQGFAPAGGIAQAPPQGAPMDPAMGGAPPMDPAMAGGGGMPPMDPAMAGGGMPQGAPPMDPAAGGGAPPMPGGEQLPPVQVSLEDLVALFAQISQESGGGGAPNEGTPDTSGALDEIMTRLEGIEGALGIGGGPAAPPSPAEVGAMPPTAEMPPMPQMGEAMAPMMDATAAPMPDMTVVASDDDGQVKIGKAEKIGDLVARLRRK